MIRDGEATFLRKGVEVYARVDGSTNLDLREVLDFTEGSSYTSFLKRAKREGRAMGIWNEYISVFTENLEGKNTATLYPYSDSLLRGLLEVHTKFEELDGDMLLVMNRMKPRGKLAEKIRYRLELPCTELEGNPNSASFRISKGQFSEESCPTFDDGTLVEIGSRPGLVVMKYPGGALMYRISDFWDAEETNVLAESLGDAEDPVFVRGVTNVSLPSYYCSRICAPQILESSAKTNHERNRERALHYITQAFLKMKCGLPIEEQDLELPEMKYGPPNLLDFARALMIPLGKPRR